MNFALIGAAGYVARKHIEAIQNCGGQLVAALDRHDSVGILDQAFPDCRFFRDPAAFARFITGTINFVSICSPNAWHASHCCLAMRAGADVICEKPLTLHLDDLDDLRRTERETNRRVSAILQLRYDRRVNGLRDLTERTRHLVRIQYDTPRGPWYDVSWKGDPYRSGGLLMNLGIHLFDLVIWLFGRPRTSTVHQRLERKAAGHLELERADVEWRLNTEVDSLRPNLKPCRQFLVDGRRVVLGEQKGDEPSLHCVAYQEIVAGRGFGIDDAEPALRLVHALKRAELENRMEIAE